VRNELHLTGDINATTDIELIYEPSGNVSSLHFNGASLKTTKSSEGFLKAAIPWSRPSYDLPDFWKSQWKYIDSLPEVHSRSYDDSKWTSCNHKTSTNSHKLETPVSLYASDYGYHTGSLLYRGHFTSSGDEGWLFIESTGGWAFGQSVWINNTFLGSWPGSSHNKTYAQNLTIPPFLQPGSTYVVTILMDHMGQDEEAPGTDEIKTPMGLINYRFDKHVKSDIAWRMTGNLGGEDYADLARGPRNEGAMFAERQGFHLPQPPTDSWRISNPITDGITTAGIGFFTTHFDLHIPSTYDIPLNLVLGNNTIRGDDGESRHYRVQIFINGYQFGKFSM
jgi:beta-galactosidase